MNNEKQLYNEIGKKIKAKRKEQNITQEQLALLSNYSLSFIANIESNTYQAFSISALYNIANALNTNIDCLLPTPKELQLTSKIKCRYCEYNVEIPIELQKLLENINFITNNHLRLTCPKCQKKIMLQKN